MVDEQTNEPTREASRWNLPNALAAFRLAGSIVVVGLILADMRVAVACLFPALFISDWLDGKLAILWRQQTRFGARLDSVADASMYAALLFGTIWLKWDFVVREAPWLIAVVVSYIVTCGAGLIKYGRIPNYHTRAAKTSWLLVGIAAIVVFAEGPVWPFRIAMTAVILTNFEATLMTLILPKWYPDVPSLWHARRLLKDTGPRLDSKSDDQPVEQHGQ